MDLNQAAQDLKSKADQTDMDDKAIDKLKQKAQEKTGQGSQNNDNQSPADSAN